jgi:serine/threonine protein kinase
VPLAPATRLGPYEILTPVGVGGMGEVYRARDARLDRSVAIKVLPDHLSTDSVRKQRFEREGSRPASVKPDLGMALNANLIDTHLA